MAGSTVGDGILEVLHGASILGLSLADAADVYSWGLTREFAAVRAAWCAQIAAAAEPGAAAAEPGDGRRQVMFSRGHLRKVIGDDR